MKSNSKNEFYINQSVTSAKKTMLLQQKILDERLRFLFGNLLTISFPTTILCASVVLGILYRGENHKAAVIWYICTLSLVMLRAVFLLIYHKYPGYYKQNLVLFIFGSCSAALLWGIVGGILMPAHDIMSQASIIIVLAGMSAGATHSFQTNRIASMSFIIISITPLLIWLLQQPVSSYIFLDISVFTFIIFMLVICNRGYIIILETIKLRYEKMLLSDELLSSSERIKSINITLVEEIAQRKIIEKKLLHLATHDKLTGLANRNYLETNFNHKLSMARQNHHRLAVLYLDIDDFKPVNDQFGHHLGDKLLIQAAARLCNSIRSNDLVVRMGGDEFVIVLIDIQDTSAVLKIANNLLQELSKPFKIESNIVTVTACIGVSIYPVDGNNIEDLIKQADISLYQAKIQGEKNCVYYNR